MSREEYTEKLPRHTKWTRDLSEWLLPFVETTETSTIDRAKLLLKHIAPSSYEGRALFKMVTNSLKANQWYVAEPTADNPTNQRLLTDEAQINTAKWESIKNTLSNLLPTESALNPERILLGLKKERQETLLAFVGRFKSIANDFDSVSRQRKLQIILRQLPSEIKNILAAFDIQEVTLDAVIQTVRRRTDWLIAGSSSDGVKALQGDMMDIDCTELEKNVNNVDNASSFQAQMRRMPISAIKAYISDFASRDKRFRGFLAYVVKSQDAAGTGQKPKQFGTADKQKGRIFTMDDYANEKLFEDDIFNEEDDDQEPQQDNAVSMIQEEVAIAATGSQHAGKLMYCPVTLEGSYGVNGLLDTGASVSVVTRKVCFKAGGVLDRKPQKVKCFNQSVMDILGTVNLLIKLGKTEKHHTFLVCEESSYPVLLGNDLLTAFKGKPNPADRVLELPKQAAIPCLAVLRHDSSEGDQAHSMTITCTEKVGVPLVEKDGVLFMPFGRSTVLPAMQARTFIMPYVCDTSVLAMDSGRLPAGLTTSSIVWMKGKQLRLTVVNSTEQAVHLGSKMAVSAIVLNGRLCHTVSFDGVKKPVRCV